MKTIIFSSILLLAFVAINGQSVFEVPLGFFEIGHYGIHFATRKSYYLSLAGVSFKNNNFKIPYKFYFQNLLEHNNCRKSSSELRSRWLDNPSIGFPRRVCIFLICLQKLPAYNSTMGWNFHRRWSMDF